MLSHPEHELVSQDVSMMIASKRVSDLNDLMLTLKGSCKIAGPDTVLLQR